MSGIIIILLNNFEELKERTSFVTVPRFCQSAFLLSSNGLIEAIAYSFNCVSIHLDSFTVTAHGHSGQGAWTKTDLLEMFVFVANNIYSGYLRIFLVETQDLRGPQCGRFSFTRM